MQWQTDWTASDNYAQGNVEDVERILLNYQAIADMSTEFFGIPITLISIALSKYSTMPFADFLNDIEHNLQQIRQWAASWIGTQTAWSPAAPAPNADDINRWEQNGQAAEAGIVNAANWSVFCGVASAGQGRLYQQRFRRR